MINLLPKIKNKLNLELPQLCQKLTNFLSSKRTRYKLATVLDLILIAVVLIYGRQPAQRMITPLVSSFNSFYSVTAHRTTEETFVFVPGLAKNKFDDVNLENLTNLSFFDVPLTTEGEINRDSRGYASFTSGETAELFDRARYQKTKIFLTVSALSRASIENILTNDEAQLRLASEVTDEIAASNIDGVTIDFEYPGGGGQYQEKFSTFIKNFTNRVHAISPQILVAVAIPSALTNNESLYNVEELSKNSDRIFLMASNLIVPEFKNGTPVNPIYGYNDNEYWSNVSNLLSGLINKTPGDALVMERAWYGNGDSYPLYVPKSSPPAEENREPSQVTLSQDTIDRLVWGVPEKGKNGARKNIPLIARALDNEGILDSNVLAYALATIEHETDETFEPIGEIQGAISARRLGYEGGANFYGRGFIQITHLRNYREFGERIGMGNELAKNPELASSPEIAAKVLAAFFKDNNVANLASRGNFVAARIPINPDYNGYSVARLAAKYGIY